MLKRSKRILVYIRRNKEFNNNVIRFSKEFFSSESLKYISEYNTTDLYLNLNDDSGDYCPETQAFIEEQIDLGKVIFRDRVLRNMPVKNAIIQVKRAVYSVKKHLCDYNCDTLITYPVDNYVQDVLCQIANIYGIKIYGLSNFFISGYKRITTYGEHNVVREPSDEEVEQVVSQLSSGFRSHMAFSKRLAIRLAIMRYVRNKARFLIFHIIIRKLMGRREYDFLATPHVATVRDLSSFLSLLYFDSKVKISGKSILIPLHYYPEATLEYWTNNVLCAEFENTLLTKISELSKMYNTIVVKEHPAMVFNNKLSFYKKLRAFKNVTLIDPFVSTSDLFDSVDTLCCWTGSAGIEFLINDKEVLFCSDNYYIQASEELSAKLEHSRNSTVSIDDKKLFIKQILSGTIQW